MSKRNLYPSLSTKKIDNEVNRIMDVLSYCDGFHSVIDIANNLNVPAWDLYKTFDKLVGENLIAKDGANRI
jgi:aminopeptidase-like protein